MYKLQQKLQKIICVLVLVGCALAFVYSLGMSTDIYKPCFSGYDVGLAEEGYFGDFKGAYLWLEMQPFNKELFSLALIALVVSVILFITCTHSRRKYYISNYIAVAVVAVLTLYVAFWALPQVDFYKNKFLTETDFAEMKNLADMLPSVYYYNDSTFWFDAGYVVFGYNVLAIVLLLANVVWKIILMKKERALLNKNKEAVAV